MKSYALLLFLSFFMASSAWADSITCNLTDKPEASEMKVTFDDEGQPQKFFFRTKGEAEYRPQDFRLQQISPLSEKGVEAFAVIPPEHVVPWEQIQGCMVPTGTQMFFQMDHQKVQYQVTFAPHFQKKDPTCRTPRIQPTVHRLDCGIPI